MEPAPAVYGSACVWLAKRQRAKCGRVLHGRSASCTTSTYSPTPSLNQVHVSVFHVPRQMGFGCSRVTCQRVVSVPTETSTGEADGLDPGHPTTDPGASSLPHHCRQRFVPSVGHQVTRALAQLQGEEPSVTLSGVPHFTFSYFLPVHSANLEWACRLAWSPPAGEGTRSGRCSGGVSLFPASGCRPSSPV